MKHRIIFFLTVGGIIFIGLHAADVMLKKNISKGSAKSKNGSGELVKKQQEILACEKKYKDIKVRLETLTQEENELRNRLAQALYENNLLTSHVQDLEQRNEDLARREHNCAQELENAQHMLLLSNSTYKTNKKQMSELEQTITQLKKQLLLLGNENALLKKERTLPKAKLLENALEQQTGAPNIEK